MLTRKESKPSFSLWIAVTSCHYPQCGSSAPVKYPAYVKCVHMMGGLTDTEISDIYSKVRLRDPAYLCKHLSAHIVSIKTPSRHPAFCSLGLHFKMGDLFLGLQSFYNHACLMFRGCCRQVVKQMEVLGSQSFFYVDVTSSVINHCLSLI
jgi:hypothetical protein